MRKGQVRARQGRRWENRAKRSPELAVCFLFFMRKVVYIWRCKSARAGNRLRREGQNVLPCQQFITFARRLLVCVWAAGCGGRRARASDWRMLAHTSDCTEGNLSNKQQGICKSAPLQ